MNRGITYHKIAHKGATRAVSFSIPKTTNSEVVMHGQGAR